MGPAGRLAPAPAFGRHAPRGRGGRRGHDRAHARAPAGLRGHVAVPSHGRQATEGGRTGGGACRPERVGHDLSSGQLPWLAPAPPQPHSCKNPRAQLVATPWFAPSTRESRYEACGGGAKSRILELCRASLPPAVGGRGARTRIGMREDGVRHALAFALLSAVGVTLIIAGSGHAYGGSPMVGLDLQIPGAQGWLHECVQADCAWHTSCQPQSCSTLPLPGGPCADYHCNASCRMGTQPVIVWRCKSPAFDDCWLHDWHTDCGIMTAGNCRCLWFPPLGPCKCAGLCGPSTGSCALEGLPCGTGGPATCV